MGRIFVTGDIHGKPICIRDAISQIDNPSEDDFIIIAGDAGFEDQDHIMVAAKREARKFPGTWIILRGNHDSSYWKEHTIWDEELILSISGIDFRGIILGIQMNNSQKKNVILLKRLHLNG